MEKEEFRVGDIVKVKTLKKMIKQYPNNIYTDQGIDFGGITFNNYMYKFSKRMAIIVSIKRGHIRLQFKDKRSKSDYYFTEEMIDPYQIKHKLHKKVEKSQKFDKRLL